MERKHLGFGDLLNKEYMLTFCMFLQVVSLLLCQGADPNARDNWNYTPLHEASIKGKIDVCIGKHETHTANIVG